MRQGARADPTACQVANPARSTSRQPEGVKFIRTICILIRRKELHQIGMWSVGSRKYSDDFSSFDLIDSAEFCVVHCFLGTFHSVPRFRSNSSSRLACKMQTSLIHRHLIII